MSTVIVACRTISEELGVALEETGCSYPVLWIESGLHIKPDSLKARLQEELDHIGNVGQVLLAFGYCGNALLGLRAGDFRLVFPRADDCITLMLGSATRRNAVNRECGTYFLTKGWLDFERNIWVEYQETVRRHGKARADRVFKVMLRHYQRLGVIDTGTYDLDGFLKRVEDIGAALQLKTQVIPGTLAYLKKLLTGPWDDDFIVVEPGGTVKVGHLYGGAAESTRKTASPQLTPFMV